MDGRVRGALPANLGVNAMQKMPNVVAVMTAFPYSIDRDDRAGKAGEMMAELGIRHLPVMHEGVLHGIVSDVDLRMASTLRPDAAVDLRVGLVCQRDPYCVDIDTPLDQVVTAMARQQLDSAVVRKGDNLAGILTTTDVCRLLAKVLGEHYVSAPPDAGDDEVA